MQLMVQGIDVGFAGSLLLVEDDLRLGVTPVIHSRSLGPWLIVPLAASS